MYPFLYFSADLLNCFYVCVKNTSFFSGLLNLSVLNVGRSIDSEILSLFIYNFRNSRIYSVSKVRNNFNFTLTNYKK
jgi:hypothetical protein